MIFLESAERMANDAPHDQGRYVDVTLLRQDEGGVVFISCDQLPELFVAVTDNEKIRSALDSSLKDAFAKEGRRVQVFTNGKVTEPTIDAVVRLTQA